MSVKLNSKLKDYIDSKSNDLMQLMYIEKVAVANKTKAPRQPANNIRHEYVIDLGEIQGPFDISQKDFDGKLIYKIRNFTDEKVGYKEEPFKEIHKLTDSIVKDKILARLVSYNFIVDNIFEWLVNSYRNKTTEPKLSQFIEARFEDAIKEHRLFFPVLYLDSVKEFNIGNVNFKYITPKFIEELAVSVQEELKDGFIKMLGKYKGILMASCKVLAEKDKAISTAIDHVTFAIDILKITSPTIDYPQLPVHFDADFRNTYQINNEVLIQTFSGENDINIDLYRKAHPFEITEQVWNFILSKNIDLLHNFSLNTLDKKTELDSLIHNAIRRFAKAISNNNLHERITQIFTVLESLLLPGESSAIIDSVCKYLPKILTKDINDRTVIISITKELYKVRSAMMHHGLQKDFDIGDLVRLQKCTQFLIQKLIQLTTKYQTKGQVLSEIDELIHRA